MNDSVVGMILTYLDDQFDKTLNQTGAWSYVKSFLIGVAYGIIDCAVMVGVAFSLFGWISTIFKKKD